MWMLKVVNFLKILMGSWGEVENLQFLFFILQIVTGYGSPHSLLFHLLDLYRFARFFKILIYVGRTIHLKNMKIDLVLFGAKVNIL